MTDKELQVFYASVRDALPCCPHCEHFSTSTEQRLGAGLNTEHEYCTLDSAKRLPPAKVIAFGCSKFVRDTPF